MTCPICGGTRWTRRSFHRFGGRRRPPPGRAWYVALRERFVPPREWIEPPGLAILARCDGCGLKAFLPPLEGALPPLAPSAASPADTYDDPVAFLAAARAGASAGATWTGTVGTAADPCQRRFVFTAATLAAALGKAGFTDVDVDGGWWTGRLTARGRAA